MSQNAKEQKSIETRARLLSAARSVFARDGYSDASLSEIITLAGVTTGAIYHHFIDKKGLLLAVAESVEQEILDEIVKRRDLDSEPWEAFEKAILETLDICARPDVQRIVFREAPTIIGLREWREVEVKYAFGVMQDTIKELTTHRVIIATDPNITAQIILGAVIEGAHTVAEANDKTHALDMAKSTIRILLRGLRKS